MKRREFMGAMATGALATASGAEPARAHGEPKPNVVFVFADQWRAQAAGYAGDPNARTPHLDRLAQQSVNFTHAISGCPVCSPYRASLITGQYWLTHGIFLNDLYLKDDAVSIAETLGTAGYDTAYIGKWHLDGHGRLSFIPPERRQGFRFWRVMECTHDYNKSYYYGDTPERLLWEGYDAIAQTREAQRYIREHKPDQPFALFLSWGPPHNPYETAPGEYRKQCHPEAIALRPNVPADHAEAARKDLAGYYAHIEALDACVGELLDTLDACNLAENTIFVFTSDHGDMLYSQGQQRKQRPFDESIRVPFLLRYPRGLGAQPRKLDTLINTPDIMPTLLGLCGVGIPKEVEGRDFSPELLRGKTPHVDAALLACIVPFGEFTRKQGGREYRGIRTPRYTYIRDLNGPWLLYDNQEDPCQLHNRCNAPEHADIQSSLDALLTATLKDRRDEFLPAPEYIRRFNYTVDANETVPIAP